MTTSTRPPPVEPSADALPLLPAERRARGVLNVARLCRSFAAAFAGLFHLVRHEPNARIHAAIAVAVTALGLAVGLAPLEWAVLVGLVGLVIGLEAMNTAIEGLADLAMPDRDPRVQTIKDLAAGGVLAGAMAAAAAGCWILGPRAPALARKVTTARRRAPEGNDDSGVPAP